jgi:hypothetical protein
MKKYEYYEIVKLIQDLYFYLLRLWDMCINSKPTNLYITLQTLYC